MGNIVQNELCEPQKTELIQKYIIKNGTTNIFQFGNVQLYKNQITNQHFFSHDCQFMIGSEKNCYQSLQELRKLNNSCPNLMHIWRITPKREFNSCNGRNKVTVFFEYLPMTLKQVIESRKSAFQQKQIYRLMRSLLVAVRHLNKKQSYHGDITPQFIYFDEQGTEKYSIKQTKNRYKIFDPVYFNPVYSGYYRAQSQNGYCAPQIIANLNQKRIYPLYNHYICDTFSIGLVVLYCMTLIDPLIAYRNAKKEIDFYYIQNLLRVAIKNGYSQELLACVRECMMVKNRPTVSQILESYQFLAQQIILQDNKFSLKKG